MGVGWHQGHSHRDGILVEINQEHNFKSLIGILQKLPVQVPGPEMVRVECDCVRAAGARTGRIMGPRKGYLDGTSGLAGAAGTLPRWPPQINVNYRIME